jgi:hypothetical protein
LPLVSGFDRLDRSDRLAVTDREERLEAAAEAAADAAMQIEMEAAQRRRDEIALPKREAKRRRGEAAPPPKSGAKKG